MRISFGTVVIDTKFGQLPQQTNQVEPAAVISAADPSLWNIVPAAADSGTYSRNM